MKSINILLVLVIFSGLFWSCSKEEAEIADEMQNRKESTFSNLDYITYKKSPLYAGQNLRVGYIDISVENSIATITYLTERNCYLNSVHMFLGDIDEMPRTSEDNPSPGLFPYKAENIEEGVQSFSFEVDLRQYKGVIDLAAHAEVYFVNENTPKVHFETAWTQNYLFSDYFGCSNWGGYTKIGFGKHEPFFVHK